MNKLGRVRLASISESDAGRMGRRTCPGVRHGGPSRSLPTHTAETTKQAYLVWLTRRASSAHRSCSGSPVTSIQRSPVQPPAFLTRVFLPAAVRSPSACPSDAKQKKR